MKKNFQKKITIPTLRGSQRRIHQLLRAFSPGFADFSQNLLQDLKLALVEGVTNAFQHGECSPKQPAQVELRMSPKQIEIQIHDSGPGFSLAAQLRKVPEALASGGRGLWVLKNLVDVVQYRRGRPNRLILRRQLTRPKNIDAALALFESLQISLQEMKSLNSLYEQWVDMVVDWFNVERASFLVFDSQQQRLKVATCRGMPSRVAKQISIAPGEGIAGYVFEAGRPLLVSNLTQMKKPGPQPRKKGYATKSFLSVPVIASPWHLEEETLGVLNLTDKRDGSSFSSQDLKWLSLIARQAASAFRTRRLLKRVKEKEALHKELQIVREIQDRLLPQKLPSFSGLQLAGHCELAVRGGGDYFDVLKTGSSLRGVMADVSGHNVGSALTMASFRSVFRSEVATATSVGALLRHLRQAMHEELVQLHQFISCWMFEYSAEGVLQVSGAGHPPLMIFRAAKQKWEWHGSKHLPLGLADGLRPQNQKILLAKDDLAFFYTDGLFDPRMRETGLDREQILQLIEKNQRRRPEWLVEQIFQTLAPHHNLLPSPDDVACLVLKKR